MDQGNGSPDSKVHGANMEPTWVLLAPGGPHVDHMNLAIRVSTIMYCLSNLHKDLKLGFWRPILWLIVLNCSFIVKFIIQLMMLCCCFVTVCSCHFTTCNWYTIKKEHTIDRRKSSKTCVFAWRNHPDIFWYVITIKTYLTNIYFGEKWHFYSETQPHYLCHDGLMQERCNSIANALELHLSCTNPSLCWVILCWCAGLFCVCIVFSSLYT